MTILESVTRKTLTTAQKKYDAISELIDANPLCDLISLRIAAQKEIAAMPFDRPATPEFLEKVQGWAIEEKRLLKLTERQQDMVGLIREKVRLQFEIEDLRRSLYFIEQKRQA